MVERHAAADCLREPLVETLPTRCRQLKKGFGDCRRGLVDMRKRFRGNLPVDRDAVGAGAGASDDPDKGYQLYGGRPAFGGAVKETSGNEPIPRDWRELENKEYRRQQAERDK